MAKQAKGQKAMTAVKVGAGIALAAAAVAGAYWLYGKDGSKNRRKVRSWALKMKGEILEKIEDAPELTRSLYEGAIEEISKRYKALKNVDPKELDVVVKDLKKAWGNISKQLGGAKKSVRKAATTAKTAAKKTVAKKN